MIAGDPAALLVFKYTGINLLLAFVASFIIRSVGVWPAGDAKTYVVAAFLIPLACYRHVYFHYFPGFTLLLNVFIAGIVYVTYKSAVTLFRSTLPAITIDKAKAAIEKVSKKLSDNWVTYLKGISAYLIVYFAMNFISRIISSKTDFLASVAPEAFNIVLFFLMKPVGNFISKYLKGINHVELYVIFVVFALYLSGWSLDRMNVMLLSMSINAMKFMLLYGGIMVSADYYINKVKVITIDKSALKKGDLPTKEFMDSLSPETKGQLRIPPEGLSEENLGLIMKELSMKRGGPGKVSVYEPIPFVPIIFAGALFTVIVGVSSVVYIKMLIFR